MKRSEGEEFVKLTVRITKTEEAMIQQLRDDHYINVSQYIRKSLKDLSEKLNYEKK